MMQKGKVGRPKGSKTKSKLIEQEKIIHDLREDLNSFIDYTKSDELLLNLEMRRMHRSTAPLNEKEQEFNSVWSEEQKRIEELWRKIKETSTNLENDKQQSLIEYLEEEKAFDDEDEELSEKEEQNVRAKYLSNFTPLSSFPDDALNCLPTDKRSILINNHDEIFNSELTYQEQIELVISLIYDSTRGSKTGPSALGKLFSISRGAMYSHIKRKELGHKEVGRPALLDDNHITLIVDHLKKKAYEAAVT